MERSPSCAAMILFIFGAVSVFSWSTFSCAVVSQPGSVGPVPASAASVEKPTPAPVSAEGCRACNGVWAVHGIATSESCNCRTRDAGKRCRDGADCQGVCIAAEEPEREIVDAGPPARGFFVGRCSDSMTVYGCNRLIDRGATARGPTAFDEPPALMCVD